MNKKYLEYVLGSAVMLGIGYVISTPIYAEETEILPEQVEEEVIIEQEEIITQSDDVIDLHTDTKREIFDECGLDYDKFLGSEVDVEYIKSQADENGYIIRNGLLFGYVGQEEYVDLTNEIKGIVQNAFAYSNVVSIVFPENLNNFDTSILGGCSNLQNIYIPSTSYTDYSVLLGAGWEHQKFPYILYTDALETDENWNKTWNQKTSFGGYATPLIEYNRDIDFFKKWRDYELYKKNNGNIDIYIPEYITLTNHRLLSWTESNKVHFDSTTYGTLYVPGTNTNIGTRALGNIKVNKVVIGEGVKTIDDSGLYGITAERIEFPDSLTTIGDFAIPKNVKYLKFGKNIKSIGNLYTGLNELKHVDYYPNTIIETMLWKYNFNTQTYNNFNIQLYDMESHFMTLNGDKYYVLENGEYAKGWMKIEDEWYYFDEDGKAVEGWQEIEGEWYFFDEDHIMQTGWYADEESENIYYLGDDGARRTGIIEVDGITYEFNEDGELVQVIE